LVVWLAVFGIITYLIGLNQVYAHLLQTTAISIGVFPFFFSSFHPLTSFHILVYFAKTHLATLLLPFKGMGGVKRKYN